MPNDAKTIFQTGEVFRSGSLILAGNLPNLMFPWVICSAFSLELYLKCLLRLEGTNARKHHRLEGLFHSLSVTDQQAIQQLYERKRVVQDAQFAAANVPQPPPSDFDFVLHASSEAFAKFRYAYEGTIQTGEGWLAGLVIESARERILEMHPEWAL